jgi:hypothetical protein
METIAIPENPFVVDGALALPSFEQWFYLPGDWAIYLLASRTPTVADLLGVGVADYGGHFAGLLAWIAWVLLAIVLVAAASAVRRFDRAVTGRIVNGAGEVRRRMRMAVVFARYRHRLRSQRLDPAFDIQEPTVKLRRHMR